MKQTIEIEIEVPDGKKAVWKDGKVVFEDAERQLPKTWEEFCDNYDRRGAPHLTFVLWSDIEDKDKLRSIEKHIALSEEEAKQHFALMQLRLLRDCYRQGWMPSYLYEQQKYNINDDSGLIGINCTNKRVSFLSFPTLELAEQFLKNFRCLIIQAGDLI